MRGRLYRIAPSLFTVSSTLPLRLQPMGHIEARASEGGAVEGGGRSEGPRNILAKVMHYILFWLASGFMGLYSYMSRLERL